MRTPKRRVKYLSFFFLVASFLSLSIFLRPLPRTSRASFSLPLPERQKIRFVYQALRALVNGEETSGVRVETF